MKPIIKQDVQGVLETFIHEPVYIHLETTNGAYTGYRNKALSAGAYIRNGKVSFSRGVIKGDGPYRIGLKMELGWIYAEGLTDWELNAENQLLLAGHDDLGRLAVALELSHKPFSY